MTKSNYMEVGKIRTRNHIMKEILSNIEVIVNAGRVMIVGERGTGRDTLAQVIHEAGPLSGEPMVTIPCRDILKNDVRGLSSDRLIYFDEIHCLKKGLQRDLIKILGSKPELRTVSSADICIGDMMDNDGFLLELYQMLTYARVGVPNLHQRGEDIPAMVREAVRFYNKKYGKSIKIDSKALTPLKHYSYRGNITELYSIIERAVLINNTGVIKVNSILSVLDSESLSLVTMMKESDLSLKESLKRYERMLIVNAIEDTDSFTKAAKLLQVNRQTLYEKCEKLGIQLRDESYAES